jgi:PhnB protein
MTKRMLMEQLDEAVQALLQRPGAGMESADAELQPLLQVAAELRGMPRESFKARLKAELESKARMAPVSEVSGNFKREGFHTITPYIAVREPEKVIAFMKATFGAEGATLGTGSARGIHAEYRIGDSMVMVGGGAEVKITPMPAALHVYVRDVDEVYERAIQAGGSTITKPQDRPYGDRDAGVQDEAGNQWYIGTNKTTGYLREGLRNVTPCLLPHGTPQVINFLRNAFLAEEVSRHASPKGVVVHATVRIGDSIIELGEAHGPFQPMPTMFYLYVESADAWYERAIKAGATSISLPADQHYGDRVAAVRDPFGNEWYMATRIAGGRK